MDSRQRKKLFNGVSGILLGYFALMLAGVFLASLGMAFIAKLKGSTSYELYEQIATSGIGYLIACGFCVLMLGIWKGWDFFPKVVKTKRLPSLYRFFQLICLFMLGQFVGSFCTTLMELLLNSLGLTAIQSITQATGQSQTFSMLLYTGFAAPIIEELLFRGAVLDSLSIVGKRFACVMSAFLFAIFHGNIAQIPFAFIIGLILAYVATEHGLVWCILLHVINNFVLAELLAPYEMLSEILIVGFSLFGAAILVNRFKKIEHYAITLPAAPRGSVRDFFTAPIPIVLMAICIISAVTGIQAL